MRNTPHPLVILAGLLIVFALIGITLKTKLLPPSATIVLVIGFSVVYRWVSRRSARAMRQRREQELERLRKTPVLGLNE
jgi:uncharacterized membrane protein YjgN (DUF898 family)